MTRLRDWWVEIFIFADVVIFAAAFLVAGAVWRAHAEPPQPGLLIVCESGGVMLMGLGSVASGRTCVLHDAAGRAATIEMLSVYNDELAVP